MTIWDILWPFGTLCVHLVHFYRLWCHAPRKIWQLCMQIYHLETLVTALINKKYLMDLFANIFYPKNNRSSRNIACIFSPKIGQNAQNGDHNV
jgi:hypothetical protein